MKDSQNEITCGDFNSLQRLVTLTGIPGKWVKLSDNHRQFRAETGAVLNYWKTTGTVNFQGAQLAADELKAVFLNRAIVIIRDR
jgi:hypothetical protein